MVLFNSCQPFDSFNTHPPGYDLYEESVSIRVKNPLNHAILQSGNRAIVKKVFLFKQSPDFLLMVEIWDLMNYLYMEFFDFWASGRSKTLQCSNRMVKQLFEGLNSIWDMFKVFNDHGTSIHRNYVQNRQFNLLKAFHRHGLFASHWGNWYWHNASFIAFITDKPGSCSALEGVYTYLRHISCRVTQVYTYSNYP